MALPAIPTRHADSAAHRQRISETVNGITSFQHDDSRVRTAAEISAGVTPVNYAYAPGNPWRYGADGSGGSSDTSALSTAALVVSADSALNGWVNGTPSGALLRTQSEVGASVLPTNYSWPPGDVRRYGADPTGQSDSTAAFQAALDAMRGPYQANGTAQTGGGNVVFIPSGVFKITSTLTVYSATRVHGVSLGFGSQAPGSVINYTGTGPLFSVSGSYTTFENLMLLQARQNPSNSVAIFYTNYSNHNAIVRCTISQGGVAVPITFTAGPALGATSATLSSAWTGPSAVYAVVFIESVGGAAEGRLVTLTNGATTATWSYGLLANCTTAGSANPQGWLAGVRMDNTQPGQELNCTEVYFSNNVIGLDWDGSASITPTGLHCHDCYFESCGTNIRLGFTELVTNIHITGGENALFGVGYGGQAHETPTSAAINIVKAKAVLLEGTSFECNGGGFSNSAGQVVVLAQDVKGLTIIGNHFWGGSGTSATNAINLSASAKGVLFTGNQVDEIAGSCITFSNGAEFEVGINQLGATATKIWDNTWTPSPTNLTVVNGTGGATYSGTWDRKGNIVTFQIKIAVTGTATTASTANSTYVGIGAMMPNCSKEGICWAVDSNVTSYGVGFISNSTSRIFLPTWSAVNRNVIIRGTYETADPQ